MHPEVVVIGGGITGAFVTYFLAKDGIPTVLVEKDELASHASGSNPGGLNPLHGPEIPGRMANIAMDSLRLHLKEFGQGAVQPITMAPRVHLFVDDRDKYGLDSLYALHMTSEGFGAQWLDRQQLVDMEPRLNPMFQGGLYTTGNYQVNSKEYTHLVSNTAVELGARILFDKVVGLDTTSNRVIGIQLAHSRIQCSQVIWATGPWVSLINEILESSIPVNPVKGDLLIGGNLEKPFANNFTWKESALYSKSRGQFWLGGTEENIGFDENPGDVARESILERCIQMIPELRNAKIHTHISGLRPVSLDYMPILGQLPGWDNAYIANGGGRKGMLLSAAMGKEISQMVLSNASVSGYPEFSANRFSQTSNTATPSSS